MIKVFAIALLVAVICRWALGRWPWEYLRGTRIRGPELSRARRLLGVRRSATQDEIRAAHRRLAAHTHPDRGGTDARIAEINAARDLLLQDLTSGKEPKP